MDSSTLAVALALMKKGGGGGGSGIDTDTVKQMIDERSIVITDDDQGNVTIQEKGAT